MSKKNKQARKSDNTLPEGTKVLYKHSPFGLHPSRDNKRITVCMVINSDRTFTVGVGIPHIETKKKFVKAFTKQNQEVFVNIPESLEFSKKLGRNLALAHATKNPAFEGAILQGESVQQVFNDIYRSLVIRHVLNQLNYEQYRKRLNNDSVRIQEAERKLIEKSVIGDYFYNPENKPKKATKKKSKEAIKTIPITDPVEATLLTA